MKKVNLAEYNKNFYQKLELLVVSAKLLNYNINHFFESEFSNSYYSFYFYDEKNIFRIRLLLNEADKIIEEISIEYYEIYSISRIIPKGNLYYKKHPTEKDLIDILNGLNNLLV